MNSPPLTPHTGASLQPSRPHHLAFTSLLATQTTWSSHISGCPELPAKTIMSKLKLAKVLGEYPRVPALASKSKSNQSAQQLQLGEDECDGLGLPRLQPQEDEPAAMDVDRPPGTGSSVLLGEGSLSLQMRADGGEKQEYYTEEEHCCRVGKFALYIEAEKEAAASRERAAREREAKMLAKGRNRMRSPVSKAVEMSSITTDLAHFCLFALRGPRLLGLLCTLLTQTQKPLLQRAVAAFVKRKGVLLTLFF